MLGKLFLTAILAATPAFAQQGGGGDPGSMGTVPSRSQPVPKSVLFAERLKLNKDQKAKAQAILVEADKEISPVRAQIDRDRAQLANLLVNGGSQEDVNKLMEAYTTAEAQITSIEVKAFTEICAQLKPEQMSKAGPAFDLLAAVFEPPHGAGTGGSGGRRGKH